MARLPRGLLAKEEVCFPNSKANLMTLLSDVAIPERLQSGQEERRRSWEVRYREANMRDWHRCGGGGEEKGEEGEEKRSESTIVIQEPTRVLG